MSDNDMLYNVKKSSCIGFIPKLYKDLQLPQMYLGESLPTWVDQQKYLGYIMTSDTKDNRDIERQIRAIYTRGNMLVRHFYQCSNDVKMQLFKSYCSNLYLCHLWCDFNDATYKRIKVAYNNVYRSLMCIQRGESISAHYVSSGISGFSEVVRKAMCSFYYRTMESSNDVIRSLVSSNYFVHGSNIFGQWNKLLFTHTK